MLVSTDCASAMARRPQTMTRVRRATAPTNLRVRIDIADSLVSQLQGFAADYMVRAVSCKQDQDARTDQSAQCPFAAGPAVAAGIGRDDIAHTYCRRSDTAYGIRTFHRRVETGHRHPAPAFASGMADRVRQISNHPAVPRAQPRHEPC